MNLSLSLFISFSLSRPLFPAHHPSHPPFHWFRDSFHRYLICSDFLHLFKNNSPLTPLPALSQQPLSISLFLLLSNFKFLGKSYLINLFTFFIEMSPAKVINNFVNKSHITVFISCLFWTFSSTLHYPYNLLPENFLCVRSLSSWFSFCLCAYTFSPFISSFVQILGFLKDLSKSFSHSPLSCKFISSLVLTSMNICALTMGIIALNSDYVIFTKSGHSDSNEYF